MPPQTRIREVLDAASDKELEFSGQLLRDVALRVNGAPLTDVVTRLVAKTKAHMVVVSRRGTWGGRGGRVHLLHVRVRCARYAGTVVVLGEVHCGHIPTPAAGNRKRAMCARHAQGSGWLLACRVLIVPSCGCSTCTHLSHPLCWTRPPRSPASGCA